MAKILKEFKNQILLPYGVVSSNNTCYTEEAVDKALADAAFIEKMATHSILGAYVKKGQSQADAPAMEPAICVTDIRKDLDRKAIVGTVQILGTRAGRALMKNIAQQSFGIAMRGRVYSPPVGSINTLEVDSFDVVEQPSFADCQLSEN